MTLTELLKPNLIVPKVSCSSKDELITILSERLYYNDKNPPLPHAEVLGKIKTREEIGGTLLPSGLSVPHARIMDYEDFIIVMGTSKEPLFHDKTQIRLMALMISSQSGGPYYLPTLAVLAKITRDEDFFSRLCAADTPEDFLHILKERDMELV